MREYEDYQVLQREKVQPGRYNKAAIEEQIFPILVNDGEYLERGVTPHRCAKLIRRSIIENNLRWCDKKIIFGEDFKKEFPKEGSQSFEYNEETQKYYPTETNLDDKEDRFLLNTIERTDEGYKVEIIEYIEDYSKVIEGQNIIIIENLNQEQIGQVSEPDSEQNIQDIVKRNIDKFSKKQIYLKQQDDKLYVEKVEN